MVSRTTDRRGIFSRAVPFTAKQDKILNIFFYAIFGSAFVSMLGVILYYVYAFAAKTHGSMDFDWLLGIFSDFVYIMNVSLEESPYLVEDSSYPPIAIAVLYPFALICKGVFAKYSSEVLTVDQLTSKVVLHPEFWIAIWLFFLACSFIIIALVCVRYKLPLKQTVKVGIIILASAPFVYAVMRGNTIYFAMIFLLLFLVLYESQSAVLREVGYVCLVLAGLIKIYPLFFGVFLLAKKKIWASARIAIYYFVLFFLSFLLLEGGLDHFAPFIENLGGFAGNELRLIEGNNLSITSILYRIAYVLRIPDSGFNVINVVVLLCVFAVATVTAIFTRSDFSRLVIASAVVVLIPSVSYFYVLVFTMLPFMEFLMNYEKLPISKQRLYFVLFTVLFLTPLILSKYFILQSLAVIVMLTVECVGVFKNELSVRLRKS